MRRLIIWAVALFLVVSTSAAVAGQTRSPGPMALMQSVQVPSWGFALSLPADWTAVDTTRADLDAIMGGLDQSHPGLAMNIRAFSEAGYLAAFPLFASAPVSAAALWSENCMVSLARAVVPLEEHLDAFLLGLETQPGVVGEPVGTLISLPAGDAARVDHVYVGSAPDGSEVETRSSAFLIIGDGVLYSLSCGDSLASHVVDDQWIAIAESFEFMPADE